MVRRTARWRRTIAARIHPAETPNATRLNHAQCASDMNTPYANPSPQPPRDG